MAEGTTDSVRFFIDADSSPQRYAILSEQTFPHFAGTPIDGVKVTLGKIGISDKDVAYGKTKLFVRDPKTLYAAEDARLKALDMIAAKVKSAKCPAKKVEGNICLEYAHLLIFEELDEFTIRRPPGKNGENNDVVYKNYQQLESDYVAGVVSPAELKGSLQAVLTDVVEPLKERFQQPKQKWYKGFMKFFGHGKQNTARMGGRS